MNLIELTVLNFKLGLLINKAEKSTKRSDYIKQIKLELKSYLEKNP